jgi:membrane-bound lytic murein transglycosylase B
MEPMQSQTLFLDSGRPLLVSALLAILVLAGCSSAPLVETKTPTPSTAEVKPPPTEVNVFEHQKKFARWVADFSTEARAAGITEATLNLAFDNVSFLPRVIESDRSQPEFTRPIWTYLDSAVSAPRINRGLESLQQHRAQIEPIAGRYGIPAEILVAIWGMESSYGHFVGDIPTIDALATLAFDGAVAGCIADIAEPRH